MFKQLFRLSLVTFVWKRYKTIILSTIVLFLFFWLVGQIHDDYVSYGNLNNDKQYIGLSFIIKWVAFVIGFIIYFLVNTWLFRTDKQPNHKTKKSNVAKLDQDNQQDPFAEIRQKDKLRSRAEIIIQKHN